MFEKKIFLTRSEKTCERNKFETYRIRLVSSLILLNNFGSALDFNIFLSLSLSFNLNLESSWFRGFSKKSKNPKKMKDTYGSVLQRHQRKRKRKNTRKRYDEDEEDENEKNENLKGTFTHFFLRRRRCDDKRFP